jgi:CheY-like chemotaxis protein
MPELDGLETTKKINQTFDQSRRPTIIAVTASQSEDESLQCLLVGMGKSFI